MSICTSIQLPAVSDDCSIDPSASNILDWVLIYWLLRMCDDAVAWKTGAVRLEQILLRVCQSDPSCGRAISHIDQEVWNTRSPMPKTRRCPLQPTEIGADKACSAFPKSPVELPCCMAFWSEKVPRMSQQAIASLQCPSPHCAISRLCCLYNYLFHLSSGVSGIRWN